MDTLLLRVTAIMGILMRSWCRLWLVSVLMLAAALGSACSSRLDRPAAGLSAPSCESFLVHMDRLVSSSRVADAGTERILGFPYLRVNRFLASFAAERPREAAYADWVERLRQLDARARHMEFRSLSVAAANELAVRTPPGVTPASFISQCGSHLLQRDLKTAGTRVELLQRARVPDAYQTGWRVVGLYPLLRWPFAEGISRLHREMRESFDKPLSALTLAGRLIRYAPEPAAFLNQAQVAAILQRSAQNPLRVPDPGGKELEHLFETFAPIWEIDTLGDDDRIGLIRLEVSGNARVDVSVPLVYRLVSHARWGGANLLQLVYLIWFPSRPAAGFGDIYAGKLDGLFWRVTLLPSGRPMAYDTIHPCGCYYQVFPGRGFRVVQPVDGSEPVLSPSPLASVSSGARLVIRIGPRTHFIQRVYADRGGFSTVSYGWRHYDDLRSLESWDGRHASLFDQAGLVPGSERPERWLFWPMGVDSAGAMRQWGTHAIAFLGRRHFDDPRLLEGLLRPLNNGY